MGSILDKRNKKQTCTGISIQPIEYHNFRVDEDATARVTRSFRLLKDGQLFDKFAIGSCLGDFITCSNIEITRIGTNTIQYREKRIFPRIVLGGGRYYGRLVERFGVYNF